MATTEEVTAAGDKLKALGPRQAIVDNDLLQTHSLRDLIEFEKFCAVNTGKIGKKMRFSKVLVRGPVSAERSNC